jgi:hypothetical protein
MFEAELNEARNLVVEVNQAMAEYYDNDVKSAVKITLIERVLAKSSILIAYLIQIRYMILAQQDNSPQSTKIALNTLLNEIKIQLDAFKTISYNFTALLYSNRDKYKEEAAIH